MRFLFLGLVLLAGCCSPKIILRASLSGPLPDEPLHEYSTSLSLEWQDKD